MHKALGWQQPVLRPGVGTWDPQSCPVDGGSPRGARQGSHRSAFSFPASRVPVQTAEA